MKTVIFALVLGFIPSSVLYAQNYAEPYVNEAAFFDRGSIAGTPDLAIDIVRGTCGFVDQNGDGDTSDPGDIEPEPFYDTLVSLTIKNPASVPINISKLYYRFPNATGKLKRKWMGGLYPVSARIIPAQDQAVVSFFVFKSNNSAKATFRPVITLPSDFGLQDIALRLDARSSSGKLFHITAKRGLSFGNEDRCSN